MRKYSIYAPILDLNIVFSPEFTDNARRQPPAIAKHQLCGVLANGLQLVLDKNDSLLKFLKGNGAGASPQLVMIGTEGTAVKYDSRIFILTLPSVITEATKEQIEAALAEYNVSSCPGLVIKAEGDNPAIPGCWFKSMENINCKGTCESVGLKYDPRTNTLTESTCVRVASRLGAENSIWANQPYYAGCYLAGGGGIDAHVKVYFGPSPFDENTSDGTRICACK